MTGIRDAKDLNAMADKLAHRGKGAGRVSSNAPPSPAPKGEGSAKVVKVKPPKTKLPEPAKSGGETPGSQGKHVTIHIHNH